MVMISAQPEHCGQAVSEPQGQAVSEPVDSAWEWSGSSPNALEVSPDADLVEKWLGDELLEKASARDSCCSDWMSYSPNESHNGRYHEYWLNHAMIHESPGYCDLSLCCQNRGCCVRPGCYDYRRGYCGEDKLDRKAATPAGIHSDNAENCNVLEQRYSNDDYDDRSIGSTGGHSNNGGRDHSSSDHSWC
jgi:hypothetical protein